MITPRTCIGLLGLILVLPAAPQAVAPPESLWVAFRFAPDEVISDVGRFTDPVQITMKDVTDPPAPVTRDGTCAYPLPVKPERLVTFSPSTTSIPAIGRRLTLLTGGNTRMTVAVERYVEHWQGDPNVSIAVIAKLLPNDLAHFRNVSSNYFLMSTANPPAQPGLAGQKVSFPGTRTTLNRFGALGDLIKLQGQLGWDIRLYRSVNGVTQPTIISFACGD